MTEKKILSELQDHLYWYKVRVDFLYDGDSITAMRLDFGFGINKEVKRGDGDGIRFYGIDAPEMRTDEGKALAKRLKVLEGKTIICKSHKDKSGKYGRYLFELFVPYNLMYGGSEDKLYVNLNQWLVEQGLAVSKNY